MMEVPNATAAVPANPVWQIDYISIEQASLVPEVIKVTVQSSAIGSNSFHLYYYTLASGVLTLQSSSSIKANATAAAFQSALQGLSTLSNYNPVVTLQMLTSSKTATLNPASAVYYEYSITIRQWRDATVATTTLPFV
jgi:hypothetical protein